MVGGGRAKRKKVRSRLNRLAVAEGGNGGGDLGRGEDEVGERGGKKRRHT